MLNWFYANNCPRTLLLWHKHNRGSKVFTSVAVADEPINVPAAGEILVGLRFISEINDYALPVVSFELQMLHLVT